jgi:hypothetical protein
MFISGNIRYIIKDSHKNFPEPYPVLGLIAEESGVKILSRIQFNTVSLESLTLTAPNMINLNNVHVEFETFKLRYLLT